LSLIYFYKRKNKFPENFILTYILENETNIIKYIEIASQKLKYKIVNVNMIEQNSIEKFIYGIYKCKAVITNSFHGTIFSIIFKKPFVSFIFKGSPKERLISLKNTFKIGNRIFDYNKMPNVHLLTKPLNINYTLINLLKFHSINLFFFQIIIKRRKENSEAMNLII
jgi:hypothetical protein